MNLLKIFLTILVFVSTLFAANKENDCEVLDRIIRQCEDTGNRLSIKPADRRFVKSLLTQSPKPDSTQASRIQISAENVCNFAHALEGMPFTREVAEEAMRATIPQDVFHTPVKINESRFYLPAGISPKKTPRRAKNLERMWCGLPPVCISFKDNKPITIDMHHISQNDEDTIIPLPSLIHKRYDKLLHRRKGQSLVNRKDFARNKRRSNKIYVLKELKKRISAKSL